MGKGRTPLTEYDILAWADYITGRPVKETAEKQDCSEATVFNRRNKVIEFIGQRFDINEYRLPIHGLFPLWLKSAIKLLGRADSAFTSSMGKGMQYFIDRAQSESVGSEMTEEELRQMEDRIVAKLAQAREKGLDKLEKREDNEGERPNKQIGEVG